MEDTWHAKCSSTRAPTLPESSSVPSLATPTSLLPSLSTGSVNCKMSRNSFCHSSAQEMSLGDAAICQGSMVFNTLNLDSRKSEKGGMTNSFLALLSGNSQHLSSDIQQTPNSRTPPAKHQLHDNIGVNGASCGLPITSTPLLLGNYGNAATVNGGLSPFVASPASNLTCTKAPLLHDSIQAAAFPCHGRDSCKLPRTFQGNISAMEVPSGRQGWPTPPSSSSSNANQKHILNPTSQAMPLEDKRSVSNVTSAFRGRPHVFCMNKVGELFVTEMGFLGVLCFCHKLPMSVANFCEHSGSPSANPGEAVRLENGMTVSQWRMLCSGIMASDHDYGWDWSNDSTAQSIFHRSKLSNYPASAKNPIPVNSMEAFGGLRRFAEPGDKFSFSDHIYTAQRGQNDLEKSTNKVVDNAHNRNNLMRYNHFTKSFTASLQRTTPVLSNKYTAQGGKENPVSISFQGASSNYNKREDNIGLQLAQNNVNYKSEVGNLPVSFTYSETKDSSLCSQNMSRGIFLSEAYVVDKEGASSNVELSLGHPFQIMHPPQLGTCNSQNPHQPQPLTHITDFPKEAKRPRPDLGGTSSGTPLLNRRKLYHSGRSNSSKGFESDPMSDATKNSLISFLSHLNNEANNPSQSTVDIGNYSECFMSKLHDRDSLHAKCNLSGFMRGKTDGIEWKIHTNKSAVSSDVGRGTEPGVIGDGSYSILKPNHLVHNKQTADVRLPASEHFIQSSFVDDKQTELNIDQPSGMLHTISDPRNFEQAQMSLSLTKSTYIPEQTSDLSCKNNNDTTQSLNDERLKYFSQINMDELSKMERCTSSLEMNPHHRRFCCLSDVKFQKNVCGDEPDAPERLRDSCIIQRDAYKTDVRSGHSFSGCCGCDHQVIATRSGKPVGSYQCCNCSASTQRTSFCSKDHGIQFSTCHLCGANKQPCLRLCTISSNSSGNPKHEVGNLKVESPSSGKCCCTASPKYLTGCCFSGGDILSNVLNGHVCGKAKITHVYPNPPYDNTHMLQAEKVVRLGQCECSRKNVMKNNSCIAVWRDVPSKAVGHSGTISNEKPSNMPHTASASGDQVTETAAKELEETQKESDSIKEQQMSNVCSGSSAPAVTEASFEVNNAISFVTDAENAKAMDDLVVDEGSRIEKCGSSDETLDNVVCEKANILKNKTKTIKYGLHYLPSSSSVDLVDKFTLKNSSNLKCLKNQNDAACAAEKITSQIRKLDWSGKAVKRKRWSKFDFASPFSEFSEHVGPSSHNSSSNEIEPPSQLECVMQKAAKRKRSALSSTKALPPKGHVNHHKVGEIEYRKMLSIADDCCLRKHTVLVEKKAKQHTSKIVKQKHNNATAGKPPKFLSLSCIGNLNNFETDTACKKARPVVCDNLGVISTGLGDQEKPAKIVPLSLVLKKATRCYITESEGERKAAFAPKTHLTDSGCYMVSSSSKLQHENADFSTINNGTEPTILVSGDDHHTPDLSQKMIKLASTLDAGLANNIQNEQVQAVDLCEVNRRRSCKGNKCESFLQDSNAFCSVCGSSNKGDVNHLLECSRCLVRVHQACYGVVKVPKGRWCCRPCKTYSLNIVCVLCGYGGGAMTRALKSENIVKGLLKAWKIGVGPDPISSITENKFLKQSPVNEGSERKGLIVGESFSSDAFPTDVSKRGLHKTNNIQHSDSSENNHEACNSITAGVLDPSVTQWVHMVCGLWTPGTRCPNVDTMSTFDVSSASPSRKKMVCAMCNRSGGSCIQCRVLNCTVRFHPWCAHQKGLLQSEIEGDNNEKVGFYGRCVHHATHNISHIHSLPVGPEVETPGKKDWTCARTKGFKGRKRDEGFNPNHQKPYNDGGGCIVSQEQINAWLHINGQKSCIRGVTKPRCSEMEYGIQFAKGSFSLMQKEYLRYKQTKGWKHLVVYKSGIHALGLYTSQFITRGAMVVEYVGEIVSLRVADKRELEYQSGRKLQYKSACYFFRIDKEHIIDATRKGGIARFVNHSCLPNCVAKIISVRNEKKVVFFAERDIYPGEEITYDYHFNHEDEGEKIPCFCNSKNCRLYLN